VSQKSEILKVLKDGYTITQLEALTWFGCSRLAARIGELRQEGMNISTTMIETHNGKYVGKYHLMEEA